MLSSSGVRSSHRPPESRAHSWAAAAACRASRYADRAPTAPPVSASSITPARSCDTDANGDEDRQSAHLMRRAISQAEACNHQRPSAPSAECAPRRQARGGTHGAARTGRRRCGSKTQGVRRVPPVMRSQSARRHRRRPALYCRLTPRRRPRHPLHTHPRRRRAYSATVLKDRPAWCGSSYRPCRAIARWLADSADADSSGYGRVLGGAGVDGQPVS